MKLGLLTATCHESDLETIAARASEIGFDALELAAWPVEGDTAASDDLVFDPAEAAKDENYAVAVYDEVREYGLDVSALAYYPNNLHPDPAKRATNHDHLKRVIESAANMDIELVGTFIGRDPSMPLDEAVAEAKEVWPPLLEHAEAHGVKLMIENCPMDHYGAYGTNLFYSPQTWEELFSSLESDHFGLNFDPSHLYWLGIDHLNCIERFADRIFHAHAKDTEIREARRNELGVLADRSITDEHWWRYRIPGFGDIDWSKYVRTLYDIGFDGTLSIEHEDPTFANTPEVFWTGAEIGYTELRQYKR